MSPLEPTAKQRNSETGANAKNWWRLCYVLTALIAVGATFLDALLLQTKLNLFTGGFLVTEHLGGLGDRALFLAASLVADAGLAFPIVAVALWVCTVARLNAKPSAAAVLVVGLAPVLVANFFTYQIHTYLGDAFQFALSYEVSGRSPVEVLATAFPHLVMPVLVVLGGGAFAVLAVWLFKKFLAGRWRELPLGPSFWGVSWRALAVLAVGLLVTGLTQLDGEALAKGIRRKPSGKLFGEVAQTLTDLDEDGYGILQRPFDSEPLNPEIFPYATEIKGNGIDENGVGGDLPADWRPYREGPAEAPRWKARPDVILIVLESFRGELVGDTFDGKPITPVLNELAREGVSAPLAFSHIGFTAPSRYYIFSGSLAHLRGSNTLIDDFKANGYQVAYFSAQDARFGGERYDVGFPRADVAYDAQVEPELRYTLFATPASIALPNEVIVDRVSTFLESRRDDRPLFLHINFQDTHYPYHNPYIEPLISTAGLSRGEIAPSRSEELWATYVNTAANVDRAVGQTLAAARRFLRDPAPAILVTSDHGEALYDDSLLGHGQSLDDVQTRVPLIVANLPMTVEQPIGHAELRDALWDALERDSEGRRSPVLVEDPNKTVLQYLGSLQRPQQIAFRTLAGRTIYDFRTDRVRFPGSDWKRPANLTPEERQEFLNLIHTWESMVVAMSRGRES